MSRWIVRDKRGYFIVSKDSNFILLQKESPILVQYFNC